MRWDEEEDPFTDEIDPELGYPKSWLRVNPLTGTTFPPSYLEEQVLQARGIPSKESLVRRLNFCQWWDTDNPWIDGALWRGCEVDEIPDVVGLPTCIGLDLGAKLDLTAAARVVRLEDDELVAEMRFWTPADTLIERERRDRVPYSSWVRDGHLIAVPGRSIDYGFVITDLAEWLIGDVTIAFDPWRIDDFQAAMDNAGVESWVLDPSTPRGEGIRLIRHAQGFGGGSSATSLWMPKSIDELEAAILNGRFKVKRNPVLTWNVASAVVVHDASNNQKWEKRKATGAHRRGRGSLGGRGRSHVTAI